jgi:hypothetical protein
VVRAIGDQQVGCGFHHGINLRHGRVPCQAQKLKSWLFFFTP